MKQYRYIGDSDMYTTNGNIYNVNSVGIFIDDTLTECSFGNNWQQFFEEITIQKETMYSENEVFNILIHFNNYPPLLNLSLKEWFEKFKK